MFVKKVELDVDAHTQKAFPNPLECEVGFIGRSNVGKSSLLNTVFGKDLAKTSSKPGKTRSLIFFKVNDRFHFIDFPGYGYARTSKTERERWASLIDSYFGIQRPRRAVFLLVDARIPTQKTDLDAFNWLIAMGERVVILSTKVDKLKRSELSRKLSDIKKDFVGAEEVLPVSVVNGEGIKALEETLYKYLIDQR